MCVLKNLTSQRKALRTQTALEWRPMWAEPPSGPLLPSQSPSPASGDSDNRSEQMSTLFFSSYFQCSLQVFKKHICLKLSPQGGRASMRIWWKKLGVTKINSLPFSLPCSKYHPPSQLKVTGVSFQSFFSAQPLLYTQKYILMKDKSKTNGCKKNVPGRASKRCWLIVR